MQILDYSGRAPSAASVAAAGYGGAARYLSWQPNPKVLSPGEARDFWSHGLSLAAVWEVGTDPTSSDPALVGAEIDRQMRSDGFPDGWGFFLAMDEDCPQSEWAKYAGWGDACARSAHRPWRAYCMTALGEQLAHDGHFPSYWDPYAWSGEDGQRAGVPGAHACLFQRLQTVVIDGTECDVNDVIQADWLGFHPGASVSTAAVAAPVVAPAPSSQAPASAASPLLFLTLLGEAMTATLFVRLCYLTFLHREPETPAAEKPFIDLFNAKGPEAALTAIVDSTEAQKRFAQTRALLDAQTV